MPRPAPTPPLKFAVVREDPEIEVALCQRLGARAVVTVASGGCTALTLAGRFPELAVTAFDLNPTQLAHLGAKQAAAARGDLRALNVDDADPAGLNACGAFEGLFRVLRQTVVDLVTPAERLEALFDPGTSAGERQAIAADMRLSPYWPAVFTTAFNDGLLHAMFGPAATQHARPGSYPPYFQAAFERGLDSAQAAHNPFLQHVFLGRYRPEDAPAYVHDRMSPARAVELVLGSLLEVPRLERFQLFSLSNVFDWSDDALVASWADALKRHAPAGSAVLMRQLNNQRDLRSFFTPQFAFDDALGRSLQARDRSLFYERIEVGVRV
jgi:S-adenosylmethionine-diacylglycerol 3-amino-3-carboxypropyl transferase